MWYESETTGADGSLYYVSDYEADDTPGTEYSGTELDGEWYGSMSACAQAEYDDLVSLAWVGGLEEGGSEEILENSTQDGAIILQVRRRTEGMKGYFDTLYYVEPENREILYREVSWYSDEDKLLSTDHYTLTYDEPYVTDDVARMRTTTGEDICYLTFVVNPAEDDMEVNQYQVNKGTSVMFMSLKDFTMYSDEELTHKITEIDTTVDEDTAFIKFNEGE